MKAKSIKAKSPEEVQDALNNSLADGFKPTLAFVFASIKQDITAIAAILDKQGIAIFGATTGGEFIDGDIGSGTIAILLVDMNLSHFKVLLGDYHDKDPRVVAQEMTAEAKEIFKDPSFKMNGLSVRSVKN